MNFLPLSLYLLLFALVNVNTLVLSNSNSSGKGVSKSEGGEGLDVVVKTNHSAQSDSTNNEISDGRTSINDEKKVNKEDSSGSDSSVESSGSGEKEGAKVGNKEDEEKNEHKSDEKNEHKSDEKNTPVDDKNNAESGPKEQTTDAATGDSVKHSEFEEYKKEEGEKVDKLAKDEQAKYEDLEAKVAKLTESVNVIEKFEEKLASIKPVTQETQSKTQQKVPGQQGKAESANIITFSKASFNCPLDCTGCSNGVGKNFFCKGTICKPYKNLTDFSCEQGLTMCGVFNVNDNQTFNLISSNSSSRTLQSFEVQGSNMNPCVELLVVPNSYVCDRMNINVLEQESQKILDPNFISTIFPTGIRFDNLLINAAPGNYKVCMAQYSNDSRLAGSFVSSLGNLFNRLSNPPPQLISIQQAGTIILT